MTRTDKIPPVDSTRWKKRRARETAQALWCVSFLSGGDVRSTMDRIEYVYTVGITDDEVESRLEETDTSVLGLASADDAYAIPVAHHYENGRLYLRLSSESEDTKLSYIEDTNAACLTLYDVDEAGDSWSVIATGPVRKLTGDEREAFDPTAVNRSFLQLRVFDEDIEAIELEIYELEIETLTGRKTVE